MVVRVVTAVLLQRRVCDHVINAVRWIGDEVANYCCHIMSLFLPFPLLPAGTLYTHFLPLRVYAFVGVGIWSSPILSSLSSRRERKKRKKY